ncbi:efflux RND transporter periplasmic adaptor subunit [Glacieibacterium sp.]|uniref:efflux RND transporter periplasmic adaptor subunit n=1 Tax=Glacieibacterium sp. TaxID=2860237 RepID=UPI003B00B8DA
MMTVAVEKAAIADFVPRLSALGTITPLQSVAVRSRVDGQITAVLFSEGQQVRAGQPLFRLDDRAVLAQIAQNRAALASATATSGQAAADLKRTQALLGSGFVSKATIEQKQAIADTGIAGIGQARAAITSAETSLSYLTIRAPVSGRTGEIGYKVGATVRSGDTVPLVTVNQLSPITARFAVPPEQIQTLRSALAAGPVTVLARPSESAPPIASGRLVFLDNNVDPTTGTLTAKAQFENRNDELWPGALVSVDLPLSMPQHLISLPEAAIQNGRDGSFVWALGDGDKVKMTQVSVVGRANGRAFIAAGITAGTRVVSDALAKLKDGDGVRVKGAGRGGPGGPGAGRGDKPKATQA